MCSPTQLNLQHDTFTFCFKCKKLISLILTTTGYHNMISSSSMYYIICCSHKSESCRRANNLILGRCPPDVSSSQQMTNKTQWILFDADTLYTQYHCRNALYQNMNVTGYLHNKNINMNFQKIEIIKQISNKQLHISKFDR